MKKLIQMLQHSTFVINRRVSDCSSVVQTERDIFTTKFDQVCPKLSNVYQNCDVVKQNEILYLLFGCCTVVIRGPWGSTKRFQDFKGATVQVESNSFSRYSFLKDIIESVVSTVEPP